MFAPLLQHILRRCHILCMSITKQDDAQYKCAIKHESVTLMSGESQTAELKSQQVPEITEAMILEWQQNPDEALLEAIRSGEVLLLSKSRQQQIIGSITARDERLQEVSQQLADIQMRYGVLTNAIFTILKSCEGIVQHSPEALEIFRGLKLMDNKGEMNWSALMGIAGDFVMGNKKSKQISGLFEKLKNGFDQGLFMSIDFKAVLGILAENNLDLRGYENLLWLIAAMQTQKEVSNG